MKIWVRGLDDVFTYPCTKREIREVFGEEVLELTSFGRDHCFERRETPGKITGRVIATLSIGLDHLSEEHRQSASLRLYRVPKADWTQYLHWQGLELMRTTLRPWAESMLARPEIAWGGNDNMLIELRDGRLFNHVRHRK